MAPKTRILIESKVLEDRAGIRSRIIVLCHPGLATVRMRCDDPSGLVAEGLVTCACGASAGFIRYERALHRLQYTGLDGAREGTTTW